MKPHTLVCALALLALAPVAPATILTFNTPSGSYTNGGANAAYGDHVTNTTMGSFNYQMGNGWTTNVVVDYTLGLNAANQSFYDDPNWPKVNYLTGPGTANHQWFLTFTPDSGFAVKVNSFDLRSYPGGVYSDQNVAWTLHQDTTNGTTISSGSVNFTQTPQFVFTNFSGAMGTFYSGPVVLELFVTASRGDGLAIDTINFDQAVAAIPEPTSVALLALAGLALLAKRSGRG